MAELFLFFHVIMLFSLAGKAANVPPLARSGMAYANENILYLIAWQSLLSQKSGYNKIEI